MPNPFSQLSSFKKCLAPSKQQASLHLANISESRNSLQIPRVQMPSFPYFNYLKAL